MNKKNLFILFLTLVSFPRPCINQAGKRRGGEGRDLAECHGLKDKSHTYTQREWGHAEMPYGD